MKSRTCTVCRKEKDISEFYLSGYYRSDTGENIPMAKCKPCFRNIKNIRKRKIKNWIEDYKASGKCAKCGYSKETHESFTAKALEFHHAQDNKDFAIGNALSKGYSIKKIQKEIDKCVLLCSRCHTEIHYSS